MPSPPLTLIDAICPSEVASSGSSRAPSSSRPSKDELKAYSDLYLEGGKGGVQIKGKKAVLIKEVAQAPLK